MARLRYLAPLALLLLLAAPKLLRAQGAEWAPPTKEMPMMPPSAELQGDWLGARADWFRGVDAITGVAVSSLRATNVSRGGTRSQMVRFTNGPVPVVVWTDRNGDGRCDMIEIFKSGGIIIQLIDADFDGGANVIRVYDSAGALLRQNPV
jgi:hypothetical protein